MGTSGNLPVSRHELIGLERDTVDPVVALFEDQVLSAFQAAYAKLTSLDIEAARKEVMDLVSRYKDQEADEAIFAEVRATRAVAALNTTWDFGLQLQHMVKDAHASVGFIPPPERVEIRSYVNAVKTCLDAFYEASVEKLLFGSDEETHNQFTRLNSGIYSIADMHAPEESSTFRLRTLEEIDVRRWGLPPQYAERLRVLLQNLIRVVPTK